MTVKKRGTARKKQRVARKAAKTIKARSKRIALPKPKPTPEKLGMVGTPQGDGDSTPLHDDDHRDIGSIEDIH